MKSILEGRTLIDLGMSNFDHTIDLGLDMALREGGDKVVAQYSGWHFCAYVIAKDRGFTCQVWTYNSPTQEYEADTLEHIMSKVQSDFGAE